MEGADLYRVLYTMNPSMVREQRDAIRKLKQTCSGA